MLDGGIEEGDLSVDVLRVSEVWCGIEAVKEGDYCCPIGVCKVFDGGGCGFCGNLEERGGG